MYRGVVTNLAKPFLLGAAEVGGNSQNSSLSNFIYGFLVMLINHVSNCVSGKPSIDKGSASILEI